MIKLSKSRTLNEINDLSKSVACIKSNGGNIEISMVIKSIYTLPPVNWNWKKNFLNKKKKKRATTKLKLFYYKQHGNKAVKRLCG